MDRQYHSRLVGAIAFMTAILAEGFARGNEFLHVVVTDAPDQEVLT
jgi:hypothetical protein